MEMLLLLSLCIVTVIQLTSSQSTYDVVQQDSCGRTEQLLSQLSRMEMTISQLQRDVAELKAAIPHTDVLGQLKKQQ